MQPLKFGLIVLSTATAMSAWCQKVVVQQPFFQTSGQSMWGDSDAPGLNNTFTIFDEYKQDFPFNTESFTLLSYQGLDFGAVIDGEVGFGVGPFEFRIEGFTLGEVAVDYQADVSLEMPPDNSFNPGETITIRSSFEANEANSQLLTMYPAAGSIGLYLGLYFNAQMGMQACFIDCAPRVSIIPPEGVTVPNPWIDDDLVFFEVSPSGVTYLCDDLLNEFQCEFNTGFPPWTIDEGAFSATLNIPHVETTSQVVNNTQLHAYGEDPYATATLDIVEFLKYLPPPVRTAAEVIKGSRSFPIAPDVTGTVRGITLEWAIVDIDLNLPFTQKQDFRFEPHIVTELTFPDSVEYVVHSRSRGDIAGKGPKIEYEVGDSVSVKFPCHYDYMDITAKHKIKSEKNFSNNTRDNISLNLDFAALDFAIIIDPYYIIPEVCIPIPFSDDLCVGPLGFPGYTFDPDPLFDPEPLTLVSQDFPPYFNRKWELQGFNEVEIADPFRLKPRERSLDLLVQHVDCHGDSTGTILAGVPGGSEPILYEWSFGATGANPADVPAGEHYVKITDRNGCVSFEPAEITQPPAIEITLQADSILCSGGATDLTASATGGAGALTYSWNTGDTGPAIIDADTGEYIVSVTDANNCVETKRTIISSPTPLQAKIANAVNPGCAGERDGAITLFVEGGTAPYRYAWSNGSAQRDQVDVPAGSYTVTVTDASDCIATDTRELTEPTPVNAALSTVSNVGCFGENNGSLQVAASGGTPPYRYKWYDSLITLSGNKAQIGELKAGTYSVEVTDAEGCSMVQKRTVTQPAQPLQADIAPIPAPCNQQAAGVLDLAVQGGTPPYQYTWSNGASTEDLYNMPPGKYDVTVTDANNCQYRNKALLIDPEPLRLTLLAWDVSCADAQDGRMEVNNIQGGVYPYEIQWSTGHSGEVIEDLAEGPYSVTVTDASGCVVEESRVLVKNDFDCLYIPNTFTPNGDDYNDTWNIRNIHLYPQVAVMVYNKWGNVIFESSGYARAWNGTYKGKPLEPGTYYYFVNLNNGTPTYKGYVEIVK